MYICLLQLCFRITFAASCSNNIEWPLDVNCQRWNEASPVTTPNQNTLAICYFFTICLSPLHQNHQTFWMLQKHNQFWFTYKFSVLSNPKLCYVSFFYPIIPIHSDLLEIGELIILMNCFSPQYNNTTLHSYKTICAKFSYCCAVVYLYYSQLIIGAYSGTVKAHLCGTYIHDQFSYMICICTAFCFYLCACIFSLQSPNFLNACRVA